MTTRRREILDLARQMFAERGVQATSIRDLAEAAGILPSSLYSHFESKEALADEILQEFLQDLLARLEKVAADAPDAIGRLRLIIRTFVGAVDTDPAALSIYRREFAYLVTLPRFAYLYETHLSIRQIWVDAIEDSMADGTLRNDVDPVVLYRWMRDAITSMSRWHRPGDQPDIDELADSAERFFTNRTDVASPPGALTL